MPATAVVFAAALVPRLAHLGRFVTWDEPAWALRTLRFWQAVLDGRWAETVPSAHPGVLTVWLGGVGLAVERWRQPAAVAWAWRVAADLPGLRDTDDAALKALGAILPGLTWPVAVFHAAGIAVAYRLARRLVGRPTAAVFAALLAFDPFAVGLSRVLHVDALQMTCGAVAVLAAGVFARRGGRRHLVVAGIATALAALAKLPGLAVALPVGVLALWPRRAEGSPGGRGSRAIAAGSLGAGGDPLAAASPPEARWPSAAGRWSTTGNVATLVMAAVLTAVALWPALWADPWATLEFVRAGSTKYAGRAVDTAHFFLGATVVEPGPRFYPVAFAFRLAPLMLLGLGASLAAWRRMRPVERRVWLVAVGLAVGYAAALSLSPKKFDRYLLPTWPAWALAAAIGYHAAWRGRMSGSSDPARGAVPPAAWRDRLPASPAARLAAIAVALVAVFQARAVLDPYAVAWYSPLGGGTAGAAAAIPVGWGEGLDRMAAAIDTDGADLGAPPGQRTMVATSAVPGLAPLVRAAVIPLDPERLADADAVVRYLADTQVPAPDWLAPVLAHTPVVTTTVHGIPFAWAYRNTAAGDIADAVRGEPAPIFTGRADYIARHLAGARVLGEGGSGESAASGDGTMGEDAAVGGGPPGAAAIQTALAAAGIGPGDDLWLVTHPLAPGADEAGAAFWLDAQAHRLRRIETAHTVATRYRLAADMAAGEPIRWTDAPAAGMRFGDHVRLARARWTAAPASWTRGAAIELTWAGADEAGGDVSTVVQLRDPAGHMWGQVDQMIPRAADLTADGGGFEGGAGGGTGVPAEASGPDARATQDLWLYPWPGTPPGRYEVWVGVYGSADGSRLPPSDTGGAPVEAERVRIGHVDVGHSPLPPTAADIGLSIALDADMGALRLVAAAILPDTPRRPGETATVHLLWEVEDAAAATGNDVALALADAGGQATPLGVSPLCATPAPCGWMPGERMRTQHTVRVPDGTAAGEYVLEATVASVTQRVGGLVVER